MLSVYAACAVITNPNSWPLSKNFQYGGSRFQLHPVVFSTRVERLSFWPTWQVMLLLDQRDWSKLLLVANLGRFCADQRACPHELCNIPGCTAVQNTDTPILLSGAFCLSTYTDLSFKSFGFLLIDTLCKCSSHLFWWFFITLWLSGISYIVWERI
jgi:hypothetical protein